MKKWILRTIRRLILEYGSVDFYLFIVRWFVARLKGRHLEINVFLNLLTKGKARRLFVQIGASDGVTNDPIYEFVRKYNWHGVLIEPLPGVFERLKKNYQTSTGLIFLNVAISDGPGTTNLYYLPEDVVDEGWQEQIASFDRRAIEFNLRSRPELIDKIAEAEVQCIRLESVFEQFVTEPVDILVIDVEGHELKVLMQLESIKNKPQYIYYEKGTMRSQDRAALIKVLRKFGYVIYDAGGDELAVMNL